MFSDKQLSPPSQKQLSYIKSLEIKTGLKFFGSNKREAIKFIDKANQTIDNKIISNKVKREDERFPFPKLADDLPTEKQWSYIESLEEKTMLRFNGITRKDAAEYIEIAKELLKSTHSNVL